MQSQCFPNINGKRVFLTGHTGFKGAWLVKWLKRAGAIVYGYALPPTTVPNHFSVGNIEADLDRNLFGDIRDLDLISREIEDFDPDLVMHLAAQSVVSRGYEDPIETITTNVVGTANVLEAIRLRNKSCAVLIVTSDKCYENVEQVWGYRETDALGEKDPYGGSKGAAELIVRSYRNSFFPIEQIEDHGVWLATARAGNVIGGGDWTDNALIVDVVNSLSRNETVVLRRPDATRPWQHVLQCLSGYLKISDKLLEKSDPLVCDSFNIGPLPGNELSVAKVAELFIKYWGSGEWSCPSPPKMKEASILRLAIDKAIWQLDWKPLWNVEETVEKTVQWYQGFFRDPDSINQITESQMMEYEQLLLNGKAVEVG